MIFFRFYICLLIFGFLGSLLAVPAADDVVILKNGKRYHGRSSRINNRVLIKSRNGKTYSFDAGEVKKLYKGRQLMREYRHRRGQLKPGDHVGEFKLARWCLLVGEEASALNWFSRAVESDNPKLLEAIIDIAAARNWDSLVETALRQGVAAAPESPYFASVATKIQALDKLEKAIREARQAARSNQRQIRRATTDGKDRTAAPMNREIIVIDRACPLCGIDQIREKCARCKGAGIVPETIRIQVPRQASTPDQSVSLERRQGYAVELQDKIEELVKLTAQVRSSLLESRIQTPRLDSAQLTVPRLIKEFELTEALAKAKTAEDYRSVIALALKKDDLDVASRAASLGLVTAPEDAGFQRLAALAGALQRIQYCLYEVEHAIEKESSRLQELAIDRARVQWMLQGNGSFAALHEVKCPRCHGGGETAGEEMRPADTGSKAAETTACPLCSGKGTLKRPRLVSRGELQKQLEALRQKREATTAYLARLQKYREGIEGLIQELSARLAAGSDDLPTIKRSWLELPQPEGRE